MDTRSPASVADQADTRLRLRYLAAALCVLIAAVFQALRAIPEAASRPAVNEGAAREFLAQRRIAVVGVSDAKDNFGRTIYEELEKRGYDVVAVTTAGPTVLGEPAHADLREVPGTLDGVIVMVHRDRAVGVVETAVELGIPRIWLFRGVGGAGAVSDAAVAAAQRAGVTVIAGACPLMFLEPTAKVHLIHRGIRRANGSLARA